ncbi:MAG TPA: hypothetical protein VFZ24_07500, partial [Longimicrobiales bacterium]
MNHRTFLAAASLSVSLVAGAAAQAPPSVTLEEARRRAEQVNPSAVAARTQVETGVWERRSAWTDLFTPHVDADI